MAENSMEIQLPATERMVGPRMLSARATAIDTGQPAEGVRVELRIEGDGSFESSSRKTRWAIMTDEKGEIRFEWWEFPVYQPRHDLKAVVHAQCDGDVHLELWDWGKEHGIKLMWG